MRFLKVAAGSVNQTPLAWDSNQRNLEAVIKAAKDQRVSILALPELCISGYGCEDAFLGSGVVERSWSMLEEIAPQCKELVVCVGLPVRLRGAIYDAACLLVDGNKVGFVAKQHLAGDGIHYEPRWFKPWPQGKRTSLTVDGVDYPFGDLYFDLNGIRVAFEICEDAWVAGRRGAAVAPQALDIVLSPSASHFAFGKQETRKRLVLEGARAFGVTYVYANLLGNEAGRAIYDGGNIIATKSRIVAAAKRFSYRDWHLCSAEVDVDATRLEQSRSTSFRTNPIDNEACVRVPFELHSVAPTETRLFEEDWESGAFVKEEEFTRAVSLGLLDYLRKTHSRGFVVSLSGGADSAAVACLVGIMAALAEAEIGMDGLAQKVGQALTSRQAWTSEMLVCVYQRTRNSSKTTEEAARQVAEALSAEFLTLDVEPLVRGYVEMIEAGLGLSLTWEKHDLALQNIQARVRGPGVWMIANLRQALLLATSNRSEAAVGYATMDGDTCGGLSPIAGIDKAFLRTWLRWLEATGPEGLGPMPALAAVTQQAPTAELRPPEAGQTDEDDLMPYPVLDAIERLAIREKLTPAQCCTRLTARFTAYQKAQIVAWVRRFFRLWARNQWKRERYAPSFHLDDENLDPKTGCRFPILSGGFVRELAELQQQEESQNNEG